MAILGAAKLWIKENGSDLFLLFFYIALSVLFIFINKLLLSPQLMTFRYPLGLSFLLMAISSALWFITMIAAVEDPEIRNAERIWMTQYPKPVFLIGAMSALSLCLRNIGYCHLSVGFMQVLKSLLPVEIFCFRYAAWSEPMSYKMLLCLSAITIGAAISSYEEASLSWFGVLCQVSSVMIEACRVNFVDYLVKRNGFRVHSASAMYYTSLCSSLCLFLLWIFFEMWKVDSFWLWDFFLLLIVGIDCFLMFALNYLACLKSSHLSALKFSCAKVIRDMVVVYLFADMMLTITSSGYMIEMRWAPTGAFGYIIAFEGVAVYYLLMNRALIEDERVQALPNETSSKRSRRKRAPAPSPEILEKKANVRLHVLLGDAY